MIKALIIDDSKATADGLKKILSLLSIDAQVAYGSVAGLTTLQQETPQILFLDINMPGVSGFEILTYIQREPRLEKLPVIIVTSDDQEETAIKAKDAGATAIMIKPVTVEALEITLVKAKLINGSEQL